jgi:hypothetical protein
VGCGEISSSAARDLSLVLLPAELVNCSSTTRPDIDADEGICRRAGASPGRRRGLFKNGVTRRALIEQGLNHQMALKHMVQELSTERWVFLNFYRRPFGSRYLGDKILQ